MTALVAWNNDAAEKRAHLKEMRAHKKADALVKGDYGSMNGQFHGCAIGCGIYSLAKRRGLENVRYGDHALYAKLTGIPQGILHLEDYLFENLPTEESKEWPVRFLSAIPVGADLSGVLPQFCVLILSRARARIGEGKEDWRVKCVAAVDTVIELHRKGWHKNQSAVWSAAESAEIQQQAKDLIDLLRKAKQ